MKKMLIKLAVVAVASATLLQTVQATPITGNIGFSGSVILNSQSVASATQAVGWNNPVVGTVISGTFASFGVTEGMTANLFSPWTFNTSTPIASFWNVDGFTFSLLSSYIYSQDNVGLVVVLAGTVSGNGYDVTPFAGSFSVQNPGSDNNDGTANFTQSLSFGSVPDGGTTVLILGATLSGLALVRRKLVA